MSALLATPVSAIVATDPGPGCPPDDELDRMAIAQIQALSAITHEPVRVLDVGSVADARPLKQATAGAGVTALNHAPYAMPVCHAVYAQPVQRHRCLMVQADLRKFDIARTLGQFDVIVCQNMLHGLPLKAALLIVKRLRRALKPQGWLYLSAAGLDSELGEDYGGRSVTLPKRYTPLSERMRAKHDLQGSVCLYRQTELAALLRHCGFAVQAHFSSNVAVMAVATLPEEPLF